MATINDVFERVVLVNLDRRVDRLAAVRAQLDTLGVRFERFPAVDGQRAAIEREWRAYALTPLMTTPPGEAAVRSYKEFYLGTASQAARTAFFEQARRRKAIATPGAWGLLLSMAAVVEKAAADRVESLLILEDDVLFHANTPFMMKRAMEQVPDDWMILKLGAMQLHWEPAWIQWPANNLYRCNGSSLAAHAVGLRGDVLPELSEACALRLLPFDIGALQQMQRRYRERCFTVYPNIAIQDRSDSEIGMSDLFFDESQKTQNIYRWRYHDYGLAAIKRAKRGEARRAGRATRAAASQPDDTTEVGEMAESGDAGSAGGFGRLLSRVRPRLPRAAWLNGPAAATRAKRGADRDRPTAPTVAPQLFDDPPLVPHARDNVAAAPTVLVIAVGLDDETYEGVLTSMAERMTTGDAMPVVLTDRADFMPLRRRSLPFEYLPYWRTDRVNARDLDWQLFLLRRLALLRRKWQPIRIIPFGETARAMLDAWRRSPFDSVVPGRDLGTLPVD